MAQDETLSSFLASRVRSASDGRLVLNAAGGLIAMALVGIWRPIGAPVLLSIAACFVAYGVWGIADRELAERRETAAPAVAPCLKVIRAIAVVAGAAAAVNALASALVLALGTWIS
jgi:hypothetical protein